MIYNNLYYSMYVGLGHGVYIYAAAAIGEKSHVVPSACKMHTDDINNHF